MRVISQKLFDETVNENVNDLGMTMDEAIADAVDSYKAQGVNLSNIITENLKYSEGHPLKSISINFKGVLDNTNEMSFNDILNDLQNFISLCREGLPNRMLAAELQYLQILIDLAEIKKDNIQIFTSCIEALACLLPDQPDIVSEPVIIYFVTKLQDLFEKYQNSNVNDLKAQQATHFLDICRHICCKHEKNRTLLVKHGILPVVVDYIVEAFYKQNPMCGRDIDAEVNNNNELPIKSQEGGQPSDKAQANSNTLSSACELLKTLTKDDDMREEFGKGAEHAVSIAAQTKAIEKFAKIIADALIADCSLEDLSKVMHTFSTLLVREQFCLKLLHLNGITLLCQMMCKHSDSPRFISACLDVLKAMCSADECRIELGSWRPQPNNPCSDQPFVSLILQIIHTHLNNPGVVKQACLTISNIALRQPETSSLLAEAGLAEAMSKALEKYQTNPPILRAVSLCIRNVVSRSPNLRTFFVPPTQIIAGKSPKQLGLDPAIVTEYKIEALLNNAMKHKECADEAKAALRDLGCKVHFDEAWKNAKSIPRES